MERGLKQKIRWLFFPDVESLAGAATELVLGLAREAVRARAAFHLVLAGGTTPSNLYRCLQDREPDLSGWHIYFGDERCLPKGNPGRNDSLTVSAWPDLLGLQRSRYSPIPAERGAKEAAIAYTPVVEKIEEFDLVLLGMGEDGHTASLFPGLPIGSDTNAADVLAIHGAPKPPSERVSLSARRLSRSRRVLFLVTGSNKCSAVRAWMEGKDLPVGHIQPKSGVDVFLDNSAAPCPLD